jgi:photosystem II stability/assembly factor-like uncharacterized protein
MAAKRRPPKPAPARPRPATADARLEEGEREFALAEERRRRGDTEQWYAAVAAKRAMREYQETDLRVPPAGAAAARPGRPVLLDRRGRRLTVRAGRNPRPRASFGFVGAVVEVPRTGRPVDGTLAVAIDPKALGDVPADTLHLFRWDARRDRFRLVPGSRLEGGRFVWARIVEPGTYALIGLHANPLVRRTVRILCGMNATFAAVPVPLRRAIVDRICHVILCAPDVARAIQDQAVWEQMWRGEGGPVGPGGRVPPPPPPEPPAGPCEQCVGLDGLIVLPECELPPLGGGGGGCTDFGWRSVGPTNVSGCIRQVVVDPAEHERLYAASSNGGLWKMESVTAYPGATWVPLTDQLDSLVTTAVAVAPLNNRIVYVAAGDWQTRIYRSTDRGRTWTQPSTRSFGTVRALMVHRSDPDTVFVAGSTGLWVSADGGAMWDQLHAGNLTDAAVDPSDTSIIYVAEYLVGVQKTYNFGAVWHTALAWSAATDPESRMIKLALGVRFPSGALQTDLDRTVVAKLGSEVFTNQNGGRPPGVTGGGPWTSRGRHGGNGYGLWCHALAVDPFDNRIILAAAQTLERTADGGGQWTAFPFGEPFHEDQQSFAFDRNNAGVVYVANDGGVFRSTDSGATWHAADRTRDVAERRDLTRGLVTAELYRVGLNDNHALANLYHSGIIGTTMLATRRWEGAEGHAWEFNNVFADANRPDSYFVFGGGNVYRRIYPTTASDFFFPIATFGPEGAGVGAIAADPRPGSEVVLVGTASPPGRLKLTRDPYVTAFVDPARPELGRDVVWEEVLVTGPGEGNVRAIAFVPDAPGAAYVMTENGTTYWKADVADATVAWQRRGRWTTSDVRQIAVNGADPERVYAVTGTRVGRSEDGGRSWLEIGAGLPPTELNSIVAHPSHPRALFVGGDVGVFFSDDDGASWQAFDQHLPNAQVLQVFWDTDWLYAVTHGRGLWRRQPCL